MDAFLRMHFLVSGQSRVETGPFSQVAFEILGALRGGKRYRLTSKTPRTPRISRATIGAAPVVTNGMRFFQFFDIDKRKGVI